MQLFNCDGDGFLFYFRVENQILEFGFVELKFFHASVKGRKVVAFGNDVDDIGDLLVDVGEPRPQVTQFGVDVARLVADGLVHLLDQERHDVGVEQFLLHLFEDVALEGFAADLFVRAALLAVALVAAVLHELTMKYFYIKVKVDTFISNSNCHSTK